MKRVAIIGSSDKPDVKATMERTQKWLKGRAEVVFAEFNVPSRAALEANLDLLIVLGGDGTLIGAVRDLGQNQIPIVGVNIGKLGYLAEFTVDTLEREGDFLFAGDLPETRRVMLEARLRSNGETFRSLAVNDCVLHAGPPYRMIDVRVEVDDDPVAQIRGDGLIVSTASGSTAHNLAAGGPILDPQAEAFVLTPICPHALTFRPLTIESSRRIVVRVTEANEGTTLAIDGRITRPFRIGDAVELRRYRAEFRLVRNPNRSIWYALRRKLMWGEAPKNHA
jgi:NAD+ kinase